MKLDANGLHHFALTVSDLERSKRFYTDILGLDAVLDVEGLSLVSGYGMLIGLHEGARPEGERFDPHRIGLDHLALPATATSLDTLRAELDQTGVPNNGVQEDELTKARYICFSIRTVFHGSSMQCRPESTSEPSPSRSRAKVGS